MLIVWGEGNLEIAGDLEDFADVGNLYHYGWHARCFPFCEVIVLRFCIFHVDHFESFQLLTLNEKTSKTSGSKIVQQKHGPMGAHVNLAKTRHVLGAGQAQLVSSLRMGWSTLTLCSSEPWTNGPAKSYTDLDLVWSVFFWGGGEVFPEGSV